MSVANSIKLSPNSIHLPGSSGFTSPSLHFLLSNELGSKHQDILGGFHSIYPVESNSMDHRLMLSKNLSIVSLHSSELSSENIALETIQNALRYMLSYQGHDSNSLSLEMASLQEGSKKRTIGIVVFGYLKHTEYYLHTLCQQAYLHLIDPYTKNLPSVPRFEDVFDVKVFHLRSLEPGKVDHVALSRLKMLLLNSGVSSSSSSPLPSTENMKGRAKGSFFSKKRTRLNVGKNLNGLVAHDCRVAMAEIIEAFQRKLHRNAATLQLSSSRAAFASYVATQVDKTVNRFKSRIDHNLKKMDKGMVAEFERRLRDLVFMLLQPLFQRHVEDTCAEIIQILGDAIERQSLMNDGQQAVEVYVAQAKAVLGQELRKLQPVGCPSNGEWSVDIAEATAVANIDRVYEAYLVELKRRGALPLTRRTVNLSFHTLLLHPFGRDHSQDPVGYHASIDTPLLSSPSVAPAAAVLPRAQAISSHLKHQQQQQQQQGGRGFRLLRRIKKSLTSVLNLNELALDDEVFAHEMASLPLSIKNPPTWSARLGKAGMGPGAANSMLPSRKLPPVASDVKERRKQGPER